MKNVPTATTLASSTRTSHLISHAAEGVGDGCGKVLERLTKLRSSAENWKNRVEQSDASKFTVAGRLQKKINPQQGPVQLPFERSLNQNGEIVSKKCPLQTINPVIDEELSADEHDNKTVTGKTTSESSIKSTSSLLSTASNSFDSNSDPQDVDERDHKAITTSTRNLFNNKEKSEKDESHGRQKTKSFSLRERVVEVPNFEIEEAFAKFFGTSKAIVERYNNSNDKDAKKSDDSSLSLSSPSSPVSTTHSSSLSTSIATTSIVSDFDDAIKPTEKLANRRTIQLPRRNKPTLNQNPIRSLAARDDIVTTYIDRKASLPMLTEKFSAESSRRGSGCHLAAEAIAGLASIEDYNSVALRSSTLPLKQFWLPYKSIMLLHIKGRTHVQVRLVEPKYTSLNSGDCFILVTKTELYRYIGAYANIIEISRSKQICASILENKDLGCKANNEIIISSSSLDDDGNGNHNGDSMQSRSADANFWKILNKPTDGDYKIPEAGHADEDDLLESSLIETNKIYEYCNEKLVPYETYWGSIPKVEMLHSSKILVFDFGSELYVWNGKNANLDDKRDALRLAQLHYSKDTVNYSDCYVNPINYVNMIGNRKHGGGGSGKTYGSGDASGNITGKLNGVQNRPDWCMFGRISQNMETCLFKEKFADWPEIEVESLGKDYLMNAMNKIDALSGVLLFEGEMIEEPNLILEQSNLGRGGSYYDSAGMRHYDIKTKSINKWQIHENIYEEETSSSEAHLGQFYSSESYIIRWIYQISVTVRELSGRISNRCTVGRNRCAYFTWQGHEATANEKGASALLTVELDKEKGSQLLIEQGKEHTVFIRLFNGALWQHEGKREDCLENRRKQWRLYHVFGNQVEETICKEVDCSASQLRSRASMLLINGMKGIVYVWHGCKCGPHTRKIGEKAAENVQNLKPTDLFLTNDDVTIEIVEELREPIEFKEALKMNVNDNMQRVQLYGSLCTKDSQADKIYKRHTTRLFHFTSTQGVLDAEELFSNLRFKGLVTPYPFHQDLLYNARQPAIFLIDDGIYLWLWMGWWPSVRKDNHLLSHEESTNGSNKSSKIENRAGVSRWIAERRAVLETAFDFWKAKYLIESDEECYEKLKDKGFLVWAGFEPTAFKSIFPEWRDREDAREANAKEGRDENPIPIVDALEELTRKEYPLEVILKRPLPEAVDPTCLEVYLSDDDFVKALGTTRHEFVEMPLWKQTKLKKEHGLF